MENFNIENYRNINISNEDLAKMISDKTETDFVVVYILIENQLSETNQRKIYLLSKDEISKIKGSDIFKDKVEISTDLKDIKIKETSNEKVFDDFIGSIKEKFNLLEYNFPYCCVEDKKFCDINWVIPYLIKKNKININDIKKTSENYIYSNEKSCCLHFGIKFSDNCQTEYIYNCIDENFEKIVEEQIENNL